VFGRDVLSVPFRRDTDGKLLFSSPFNMPTITTMWQASAEGLAFAIGVCSLLFALDTMQLGRMPWQAILHDALLSAKPGRADKLTQVDKLISSKPKA
jgi:hypothetical protein